MIGTQAWDACLHDRKYVGMEIYLLQRQEPREALKDYMCVHQWSMSDEMRKSKQAERS